jgi:hypothetical protein
MTTTIETQLIFTRAKPSWRPVYTGFSMYKTGVIASSWANVVRPKGKEWRVVSVLGSCHRLDQISTLSAIWPPSSTLKSQIDARSSLHSLPRHRQNPPSSTSRLHHSRRGELQTRTRNCTRAAKASNGAQSAKQIPTGPNQRADRTPNRPNQDSLRLVLAQRDGPLTCPLPCISPASACLQASCVTTASLQLAGPEGSSDAGALPAHVNSS